MPQVELLWTVSHGLLQGCPDGSLTSPARLNCFGAGLLVAGIVSSASLDFRSTPRDRACRDKPQRAQTAGCRRRVRDLGGPPSSFLPMSSTTRQGRQEERTGKIIQTLSTPSYSSNYLLMDEQDPGLVNASQRTRETRAKDANSHQRLSMPSHPWQ